MTMPSVEALLDSGQMTRDYLHRCVETYFTRLGRQDGEDDTKGYAAIDHAQSGVRLYFLIMEPDDRDATAVIFTRPDVDAMRASNDQVAAQLAQAVQVGDCMLDQRN
jgi:hypothetical protein